MQPLLLLLLGLGLGLRHAADPDHVVAVTAIAGRAKRVLPATLLGVVWGLGHTLTLFIVAGMIIFFNWTVPPRLGLTMEFCVALALVVVGYLNLRGHRHTGIDLQSGFGKRRAFVVGIVHGLAGSAAVALLVLTTVHDPRWAFAYLLAFGLGTLLGMALITTGFALPIATVAHHWQGSGNVIRIATGALSFGMGMWLVYHIGWSDGLFLAEPSWTPH